MSNQFIDIELVTRRDVLARISEAENWDLSALGH
jgi:hypothetical protein